MRADARVFKKQDDRSDVNRIVSIDVPELGCQGDYVIFPGFCDVHVHLREPGFSYKETIETGTKAAAHGGYTTICPMPNLNPELRRQPMAAIRRSVRCQTSIPYRIIMNI